jgi:hypothetical protein
MRVDSISALKALSPVVGDLAELTGYYSPGDGGGGSFYWDSASTEIPNDGTIIEPNSLPATGRWKREIWEPVNVQWFGAIPDYDKSTQTGTDNTIAFQKAVDYLNSIGGGTLFIPGGNYLKAGTTYVNFGGSRPFSIVTGLLNVRNTTAPKAGATIVCNTPNTDIFRVNLDVNGKSVQPADSGYPAFGASGLSFLCLQTGINCFKTFRTSCNIQNITSDGANWLVLNENTDTSGNPNYSDKCIYKNLRIGNTRTGGLRLFKPDASQVSEIFFEGDDFVYSNGIEVIGADGLTIQNILMWFAIGGTVTPVPGSEFINLVNCSAVKISDLHIEHAHFDNLFAISGCKGVSISELFSKFSRRGGFLISGGCNGIQITNWNSFDDVLDSYYDVKIAASSPAALGVTYQNCVFTSSTNPAVTRTINLIVDDINSVSAVVPLPRSLDTFGTDANMTLAEGNVNVFLRDITAIRTITLPPLSTNFGQVITFTNRNTSTFNWIFSAPIKDANGSDFTIIRSNAILQIQCLFNGWRIKTEQTDPYMDIVAGTNANYTFTKANVNLNIPTLTANRVVTLPAANLFKGKRITIANNNSTAFAVTTNVNMLGAGFSTNVIPNQSYISLISDNANWRIEYIYKVDTKVDATTTAYAKSSINTAYPYASTGFTVICSLISSGGMTYIKMDNSPTGDWSSFPVSTLV